MMRSLATLILICLALLQSAQAQQDDAVRIEQNVLQRWESVRSMSVSEATRAYIDEGEAILAQYNELLAMERQAADRETRTELNIEVSKLKLRLIALLRQIEEAALFDLNATQLEALKQRYLAEQETLLTHRTELRDDILAKGEEFLYQYRRNRQMQQFSQRDVVAKLCLRLAELYYDRSEEEYFNAQDEMLARMEANLPTGMEPIRDFNDAVLKYQRVIDEFPFSEYMDDALYNVAYIRENSSDAVQVEEARRLFEQLVRDFPQSRYAPEAWMRLAEYWFRRDGDENIRQAVECYTQVMGYDDYPAREKALYKLGWCYYRLEDNETSVDYFTQAALYAASKLKEGDQLSAALLDESIAYIAINFADVDWDKANIASLSSYVRDDRAVREGFGFQLMDRYGDLYRTEVQQFEKAVVAYDSLIAIYPDSAELPFVQEKVILCYSPGALNDPTMAYQEKNQLYDEFSAESAWGQRVGVSDQDRLNGLLNQHLQENVTIAMHQAYASGLQEKQDEFVDLSRKYLRTFPADTAAYLIHWNMAKTLEAEMQDYPTAYEEYLSISREYPGRDVHDAAYNAIVIAQIMVDQEKLTAPIAEPIEEPTEAPAEPEAVTVEGEEEAETESVAVTGLTPMEELKEAALLNYVELFPEAENSPDYLLTAGKQYYSHQSFPHAVEVFDRVIESYPGTPQFEEAYKLKLEGLFALGSFQQAEAVAVTIQQLGLSAELVDRARTRQAESAYAFADELRSSEDHLSAAQEFKRTALEVPDAAFADAALYDAADEFSKAEAWPEATDTYLYLADHYPQSKFADRAVSLAGFIFLNEMQDWHAAAITFEKLAMEFPSSEYAKTAITNAAYCYDQEKDYLGTIRMNQLYVERYPDAEDANLVLFANAGLYLKLDDIDSANRIYADFARLFPDDPRTVQAYVERGDYFLRQEREYEARSEYDQAVQRNRQLRARGLDGNSFYAARALRKIIDWSFEEYKAINLTQPQATLSRQLDEKKRRRDSLLHDLDELVGMGTGDVFYARYLLAACHEEFARAYREQERVSYSTASQEVQGEIEIQDAAHLLAKVAVESYVATTRELEGAVESLQRQRRALRERRDTLADFLAAFDNDSLSPPEDSLAQQLQLKRAADLMDSSLTESTIWTSRSREKVPEILMASLAEYEKRVPLSLSIGSQFRDDVFMRLADLDHSVYGGAALVTTQSVVEAYREALELIAQVGLERNWRPRVEARVRATLALLPGAYSSFIDEAYLAMGNSVDVFLRTVDRGEDYVDNRGFAEEDYGNEVLDMADYNQGYAINSLMIYDRLIQILEANQLGATLAPELCDSMALGALERSRKMVELADSLRSIKDIYWERFQSSQLYVDQDASVFLEDAAYFLGVSSKEVMLQSEPIISRVNPVSVPARRLYFALAQEDPARFGEKFGLGENKKLFTTATGYLARRGYESGWDMLEGTTQGWMQVMQAEGIVCPEGAPAIWLLRADAAPETLEVAAADLAMYPVIQILDTLETAASMADSLSVPADSVTQVNADLRLRVLAAAPSAGAEADTVFFRSRFTLDGTPTGARVEIAADDAYYLFFNGEYIEERQAEAGSVLRVESYDLGEFIQAGDNLLAVEVQDRDGSGGAVAVKVEVEQIATLTQELFDAQIEREQERQRQQEMLIRMNRLYDKNRME